MTIIIVITVEVFMKLLPDIDYVSVAETKAKLSEKLRIIDKKGRRFAITSHGKPKAVLIGYNEYIALVQKADEVEPEKISLKEWQKEKKKRAEIINSVSEIFDTSRLSRKGQKRYKKNAVKKMGETKK